jgi:prepilin-type N-terminal cleavage/methylation domain-containing protein
VSKIIQDSGTRSGSHCSLQKGLTMIEVVIVMGILALAIIPIYQNIMQGRLNVTRSRFSYVALNLARERMEVMMSLPFKEVKSHPYERIAGPVVSEELLNTAHRGKKGKSSAVSGVALGGGFAGGNRVSDGRSPKDAIDANLVVGIGDYPKQYQRFEVQVAVKKKGKRFKQVRIDVRWYEKGEADLRQNKYLYSLTSLVANHHLAAYR